MIWANCESQRLKATPKAKATCPLCGGDVVAKCGKIVTHHWAHKSADCDPWYEPESDWHFNWKCQFPKEYQEVTVGNHRADVKTKKLVVEFQRSSISTDEIQEREYHYKNMVWVLCGYDFWKNIKPTRGWRNSQYQIIYDWYHARKSWLFAKKPIVIDSPNGLLLIKGGIDVFSVDIGGWGREDFRTRYSFVTEYLSHCDFLRRCGLSETQIQTEHAPSFMEAA